MFSGLLFFRPPIAPVPTASKHPEGLGFPTGDMGTEGWLSQITAEACLVSHQTAEREGRGVRIGHDIPLVQVLCSSWGGPRALL